MTGEKTLIRDASANAAAVRLLADDIACLLFPRTGEVPSEELQASARLALNLLVSGVEYGLGASHDGEPPKSWHMLSRSGLLREPALIDYCLARIAEGRIRKRLENSGLRLLEQLPARLLHHDNPLLANTARNVLVAENQSRALGALSLTSQLPPELLHLLAWRVVAVLKTEHVATLDKSGRHFENACNIMLAGRNDASLLQNAAAKLVYFLPPALRDDLAHPAKAGLPAFVATVSSRTAVSADLVYRFADADAMTPFLVILRAAGFGANDAFALIRLLRGARSGDQRLPELMREYEKCGVDEAVALCVSLAANGGGV